MKTTKLLTFTLLLLLFSCSSDPCEDLSCVNGNCVDGTCQCDEGFAGELCDELYCVNGTSVNGKCQCEDGSYGELCNVSEITGYYFITQLLHTDCPNYAKEYDLNADISEGRVCGTNHTNLGICFSNGVSIDRDGTMFWIRSIVLETSPGEFETTWFELKKGTYTAQNDQIIINLEDGGTRNVTIAQDQLIWERNTTDGGPDCIWREEYRIDRE